MTGKKTIAGRGVLFTSSAPEFTEFGPGGFTPEAAGLYDEKVAPAAKARSGWGGLIETLVEKAVDAAVAVATRGSRPGFAYAREGDLGRLSYAGGAARIDAIEPLLSEYGARPAEQGWLQRVTGKLGRYVYGAAVPDGKDRGTYVDEGLLKGAGRYLKGLWDGAIEEATKYAGHFVETLLTLDHEDAHQRGIGSEHGAEQYARERVSERAGRDRTVQFALSQYSRREGGLSLAA